MLSVSAAQLSGLRTARSLRSAGTDILESEDLIANCDWGPGISGDPSSSEGEDEAGGSLHVQPKELSEDGRQLPSVRSYSSNDEQFTFLSARSKQQTRTVSREQDKRMLFPSRSEVRAMCIYGIA
jgi:hypothetical protein